MFIGFKINLQNYNENDIKLYIYFLILDIFQLKH